MRWVNDVRSCDRVIFARGRLGRTVSVPVQIMTTASAKVRGQPSARSLMEKSLPLATASAIYSPDVSGMTPVSLRQPTWRAPLVELCSVAPAYGLDMACEHFLLLRRL